MVFKLFQQCNISFPSGIVFFKSDLYCFPDKKNIVRHRFSFSAKPFIMSHKMIKCVVPSMSKIFTHFVPYVFIPHHTIVAGYFGFTLDVCVYVRLSINPSVVHLSIRQAICFSFPDDNLSKHQWIFTKFGMFIDIVEIWFGIANGQISSHAPYFRFRMIT